MRFLQSLLPPLVLLSSVVESLKILQHFYPQPYTVNTLDINQIQRDLGAIVSDGTTIFGPTDDRFANAIERWSHFAAPTIQLVIKPSTESEVALIVKYCSQSSIEFLAVNRGHGWISSLGAFNGVQINLVNLRNIAILPGGQSAWFQGGVHDGEINSYLWPEGYVATTGSCDCVGVLGAGLGGGHGRLEGLYGMISDNILQFNVVLTDGPDILVNGNNEHRDLY